jgi:hypothetical protein
VRAIGHNAAAIERHFSSPTKARAATGRSAIEGFKKAVRE